MGINMTFIPRGFDETSLAKFLGSFFVENVHRQISFDEATLATFPP